MAAGLIDDDDFIVLRLTARCPLEVFRQHLRFFRSDQLRQRHTPGLGGAVARYVFDGGVDGEQSTFCIEGEDSIRVVPEERFVAPLALLQFGGLR
jgi:hypothetical protein